MTRDQIITKWETLTPRERDAWVAEVVFGQKTYGAFYEPNGVRILIPRYTEDIAAAWTLLATASYGVKINVAPIHTRVNFHRNGWTQYDVWRPTAPDAISLAAIVAILSPAE